MKYLGIVVGCAATGAVADVPKVAVDIAPVHSIVSAVMGELGTPDLVIPAGASPHGYSMRPSEARALDQADVFVWMGHALAPWLEGPVDSLAEDAVVVELLEHPQTLLLDVREGVTFEEHDHDHDDHDGEEHADAHDHDDHDDHDEEHAEAHDHDDHDDHDEEKHADAHDHDDHDDHDKEEHADAHDHDEHGDEEHADAHDHDDHDDHGEEKHADAHDHDEHGDEEHADAHDHAEHEGVDPHAWLDPENAIIWSGAIAQLLGEQDPENAETYAANAQAFQADIEALKGEITATLEPVKGRPFVVFHDAYHYFEDRFGVEAVGSVSASDAVSPSAGRVAELREKIADLGAVCALTEPQYNPGIVDAIGTTELGEIDPLGVYLDLGAGLYRDLLTNMAKSLSDCLTPPA